MIIDKQFYPDFGEVLAVCLQVCGYRMPPDTTATAIGREIFGCDASGLRKRFTGQVAISSAELSRIIVRFKLDADGIFPEDLTLDSEALRQQMKSKHAGIYGRAAGVTLYRAIADYQGESASLEIRRDSRRGSAFTSESEHVDDTLNMLRPYELIRFACQGPTFARLLLLDYPADGTDATLLSPATLGAWSPVQGDGVNYIPVRTEAPLTVRRIEGNRHASAIWVDSEFGAQFDQMLDQPQQGRVKAFEFRDLDKHAIRILAEAISGSVNGPVRAAYTQTYRVNV